MDANIIYAKDLVTMIENGAKCLASDYERINALNVFPVPDGDTGSNMKQTIEGGVVEGKRSSEENLGELSKAMARSMVLSARGNSGVILSQFFKGLSNGLQGYEKVNVKEFALAMIAGTRRSYEVVSNPTEGTMLTVMREAGEKAYNDLKDDTTLQSYLESYVRYAEVSLENTPNLLAVLKKAGVVDSGAAGFVLVVKGMYLASKGQLIEDGVNYAASIKPTKKEAKLTFNADSELTYGYCTEFILQLQNSKVDTKNFDLNIINNFLESIGNSVVSFKDEDIVKVHVHVLDPGKVLSEMKKYGEFLTVKIENMNLQNSENHEFYEDMDIEQKEFTPAAETKKEHKKFALVAVANGDGIKKAFEEMGVDVVVSGGQTMNTSTQDFIDAFDKLDAEYIFVYPNNGNIRMAAAQAAEAYEKSTVVVIPTKTISQGYSAISMLNYDSEDIDQIVEEEKAAIDAVDTIEVTYSIRNTNVNDIDIEKDDTICLLNDNLVSAGKNRVDAIKNCMDQIEGFEDKAVMTIICGIDAKTEEYEEIVAYALEKNSYIEVYQVLGEQDVYSYIVGVE